MYNREEWDQIYEKHFNDAPWMSSTCIDIYSRIIDNYIPNCLSGVHILDYGCGSGKLTFRLKNKGANVDFAEISHLMVDWLQKEYCEQDINLFEVTYPQQINCKKNYDLILAWMFFCNIHPDYWEMFLNGFYDLLKPDAMLLIGGWDIEDPINKRNNYIISFTSHQAWPINHLTNYFGNQYEVISDNQVWVKLPYYEEQRALRCYQLKRN